VIASAQRPLGEMVEQGLFRRDLYFASMSRPVEIRLPQTERLSPMKQMSFADAKYAGKRKQTRRKRFLIKMDKVVP
jgi:transcriptional regulator of acetoin/glycerol metabolism